MGWIAAAWSLMLIPIIGPASWAHSSAAAVLHVYLPFVSVIGGLFVAANGILLRGGPWGRPGGNTLLLAVGALLALVMGTAGAAMVVVQPLLHANAHRKRRFHLVLFLILLVANVAGLLTPLGNPPLYAGMLRGVPFFWPASHLFRVWLLAVGLLLTMFFAVDYMLARNEARARSFEVDLNLRPSRSQPPGRFRIRGWGNVALVLLLAGVTMAPVSPVPFAILAAAVSWWITPRAVRQANDFSWHPMVEVAVLFAGIFITLEPVSGLLQQGLDGPFRFALQAIANEAGDPRPASMFWLTGVLSAFLDNAPAYLVFFDLAGIRPEAMTTAQAAALRAISAGAVMFGGLTYIGNAPNMMLRAVASHRGVRMPGFVGFLLWAAAVMMPVLGVISLTF